MEKKGSNNITPIVVPRKVNCGWVMTIRNFDEEILKLVIISFIKNLKLGENAIIFHKFQFDNQDSYDCIYYVMIQDFFVALKFKNTLDMYLQKQQPSPSIDKQIKWLFIDNAFDL
mmetsp:Transcript_17248/g.25871  ORF Transcript_17248/g.25871 Transcript_17248/m.25871 type:complete len:115 (-) Transcript_17248:1301-1645(-)